MRYETHKTVPVRVVAHVTGQQEMTHVTTMGELRVTCSWNSWVVHSTACYLAEHRSIEINVSDLVHVWIELIDPKPDLYHEKSVLDLYTGAGTTITFSGFDAFENSFRTHMQFLNYDQDDVNTIRDRIITDLQTTGKASITEINATVHLNDFTKI